MKSYHFLFLLHFDLKAFKACKNKTLKLSSALYIGHDKLAVQLTLRQSFWQYDRKICSMIGKYSALDLINYLSILEDSKQNNFPSTKRGGGDFVVCTNPNYNFF